MGGRTALDPVVLLLCAAAEVDADGVRRPLARAGAHGVHVARAAVDRRLAGPLARLGGPEVHHGEGHHQLHRAGVRQGARVAVPPGALKEHAADVRPVRWGGRHLRLLVALQDGELPREHVHAHAAGARRGLQQGSEEARRVREAAHPVHPGVAALRPGAEHRHALRHVAHPRRERLERREAAAPSGRHLADRQARHHVVQLRRHDHQAAYSPLHVPQRVGHSAQQLVVPLQLLHEEHVQRRRVVRLVHPARRQVQRRRHRLGEVTRQLEHPLLAAGAAPAAHLLRLQAAQRVEDGGRVGDLCCDVGVAVLAEGLRVVQHGQAADVVGVRAHGSVVRDAVDLQRRGEEEGLGRKGLLYEVGADVGADEAEVEVVGDAAAVVGVGDKVAQGVPWGGRVRVEVVGQTVLRDVEVTLIEVVGHVVA